MWLSGNAPHGDHPGAPRARVQPRSHHDGAERRLQLLPRRRLGEDDREPGAPACAAGRAAAPAAEEPQGGRAQHRRESRVRSRGSSAGQGL